jgi:hypothetical protein
LKATNLKPHQAHPNQLESISIQFKPDYYKNNNVSFHHAVALFHISIPIRSNSIQFKSVLILWRFNPDSTEVHGKKPYSTISNLVTEKLSGLLDVKEMKERPGFKSF